MTFSNPIVGGVTLVRPAIQSPNYTAGVSGWAIKKDGSAEFNNIVLRGSGTIDAIIVGPPTGSQVVVGSTPTVGFIKFPTNRAIENLKATILSAVGNIDAANEFASLQIQGPTVDGATDQAAIQVNSQNNDGSSNANIQLSAGGGFVTFDKTRFTLSPTASANSALFINAAAGQTGNLLRAQVGGTDKAVINASGDLTVNNIQKGLASVTTVANQWVEVAVTFPHAFTSAPVVTVTGNDNAPAVGGTTTLYYAATAVTTTGFTLRVFRGTAITMNIGYIAIDG